LAVLNRTKKDNTSWYCFDLYKQSFVYALPPGKWLNALSNPTKNLPATSVQSSVIFPLHIGMDIDFIPRTSVSLAILRNLAFKQNTKSPRNIGTQT